jgi:hypothetical protein
MAKYQSFTTKKNKLRTLFSNIEKNSSDIKFLDNWNIKHTTETHITTSGVVELDTTLQFKDIYKFTGITFTTNEAQAVPAELYEFDGTAYRFIYPVYGFQVEADEDPNETLGGTWELQTRVAIVNSSFFFPNLTDRIVSESKLMVYLFVPDNTIPIPELRINIDPIKEIYADYEYFHRWIKQETGYRLDFFSFFPYPEDIDLRIKSNVIIYNLGDINVIQNYKT